MSFANSMREELIGIPVRHPCCRRALLCGLFLGALRATDGAKKETVRRFRDPATASFVAELLQMQYGKEATVRRIGSCGRFYGELSFSAPAFSRMLEELHAPDADPENIPGFRCDGCRSSLLRGLFLACGTVNDPRKSSHLEFILPDSVSADYASRFLAGSGYPAKRVTRAAGIGLYFKDSAAMEDLITLMGSHHVIFEVINGRIEREIRNNENRATNCDTRNIRKMVTAVGKQIAAIEKLRASGKLEGLPEELRVTAKLRYENQESSLEALAKLHDPPVTKSGLNHRLQRLMEAADEL